MPYIGNIVQDFSVNTAMLNTDSVTSIKIDDGTIVNADINDSAAIAMSKLALSITNSEINASAAIAGTKISPDFGSQAIVTTGAITGQDFRTASSQTFFLTSGDDWNFRTITGSTKLTITNTGQVDFAGNVDCNAGLDVTGNITTTSGNLTVDGEGSVEDVFKISDQAGGQRLLMGNRDSAGVDCPRIFNVGNAALTIGIGDSWSGDGGTLTSQFTIAKNGTITSVGNHDFSAGIDVTGAITGTGDMTIDTNTLHVDSSNDQVGIGTTSPGQKLGVAGNIRFESADPTLEFNNGGAMVYARAANTLQFATGGGPSSPQEKMQIDSSGNLLHGVTSSEDTTGNSGTKLITAGDLQIDGDQKALLFRSTASTAQKLSGIQWWNENGAGVECAIFGIREAVSNAPSALAFYTSANVDTAANNGEGDITERMRINSTGDAIFSRNLTLEGGSNHAYPIIELHSSATNVRKWRIYNGQAWNPDALLIYDVDGDNTAVTIEPNKLGINKGASSLTEAFEVSGNATITGNLILETSGAGVDFSAGADSASTSNLLDEYEEGEYTPALSNGQSFFNTSYDRLRYTKIGRQVTLTGQLVFAAYNSSNFSSTFTIGLPFNNGNGGDRSEYLFHAGIGYFNPSGTSSPSSGYQPIGFYAAANSSHVSLFAIDPNTDTTIGNWVGSGSDIWVNLTYFTD